MKWLHRLRWRLHNRAGRWIASGLRTGRVWHFEVVELLDDLALLVGHAQELLSWRQRP